MTNLMCYFKFMLIGFYAFAAIRCWKLHVFWGCFPSACFSPKARFWPPLSHMVSAQPFPDRPRPMSWKSPQAGFCPITFLWLWPPTDHEPDIVDTCPLTEFEGGLKLLHETDVNAVIMAASTATAALAKRKARKYVSWTLWAQYFTNCFVECRYDFGSPGDRDELKSKGQD